MHPILNDWRRLGLYLLGWLPIGLLLSAGLGQSGSWLTAAAVFLPLSFGVRVHLPERRVYLSRVPDRRAVVHLAHGAGARGGRGDGQRDMGRDWRRVDSRARFSSRGLAPAPSYAGKRPLLFVIGALLFWLASILHYLLIAFEASQEAERRALEQTLLTRDAELKALRAQIDPHFLFNSLHSISALTASDPAAARRMCLLLADFLRDTLRLASNRSISLGGEFALADRYLEIERVRLGSRLNVERKTDPEVAACLVPPLLLQPLVENAIVHGIGGLLDGGTIRIEARSRHHTLRSR